MTREVLSVKQFSELSCTAFADALASKTPAPGGGGSAAMTGALGIALCSMAGHSAAPQSRGSGQTASPAARLAGLCIPCGYPDSSKDLP